MFAFSVKGALLVVFFVNTTIVNTAFYPSIAAMASAALGRPNNPVRVTEAEASRPA